VTSRWGIEVRQEQQIEPRTPLRFYNGSHTRSQRPFGSFLCFVIQSIINRQPDTKTKLLFIPHLRRIRDCT
jgi:hypothetical protein